MVKAFQSYIEAFEEAIRELWNFYGPVIHAHIRKLKGINSIFGGDLFPHIRRI